MNFPVDFWLSKELWAAGIQAAAGLLQGVATVLAVYLAFVFGSRRVHQQTQIQVRQDLRQRQADALQQAWGLLQCLTLVENGRNFLLYETMPKTPSGSGQRRYAVHLANAQAFVFVHLPSAFYAQGAGLHWSTEVKAKFFECRNLVYAFLLAEQQAHAPVVTSSTGPEPVTLPLHKPELAQRIETLHQELLALLRQEMAFVFNPAV